jgi:uncharacterized protein (TIGR02145 family)
MKRVIFYCFAFVLALLCVSSVPIFGGDDKSNRPDGFSPTGTVTDIDGNVYQTIQIGDQWWMAENLKVTKYRNSDPIPNVTGTSAWTSLTTGAYCNQGNDEGNVAVYGRLYNFYAVEDSRNIAPEGWHVATDEEWKQMEMYLGMSQSQADAIGARGTDEGGKLKETGTTHWNPPNTGATNESGFTALPGGYRNYPDGGFKVFGDWANFWTSSASSSSAGYDRHLITSGSQINRYNNQHKRHGLSVRCVKDGPMESYTFVHITDPHIGTTGSIERFEQMIFLINYTLNPAPDFVVISGDLVHHGCGAIGASHFQAFVDLAEGPGGFNMPYYACPGNHETHGGCGTANYESYIHPELNYDLNYVEFLPGIKLISMFSGTNYSWLDCGEWWWPIIFPVLTLAKIDWMPEGSGLSSTDITWLSNRLTDDEQNKILFMHHPIVYFDDHYKCSEDPYGGNACIFNNRLAAWDKLHDPNDDDDYSDAAKVVLGGHTHSSSMYISSDSYPPQSALVTSNNYISTIVPQYRDQLPFLITTSAAGEYMGFRIIEVIGDEIRVYGNDHQYSTVNYAMDYIPWFTPPGTKSYPYDTDSIYGPAGRIHAYDLYGNHVGVNDTNGIDSEIDLAYYEDISEYYNSLDTILFQGELISLIYGSQDYVYEFEAMVDCSLNIHGKIQNTDGTSVSFSYSDSAYESSVARAYIFGDSIDYTLYMDDDGDGMTDREIMPVSIIYDFLCGDSNNDEIVNVSDAVWIINYVFVGGDPPDPIESGDCNCDATCNVSDAVWIINYVFVGGNEPCDTDGDSIPDC